MNLHHDNILLNSFQVYRTQLSLLIILSVVAAGAAPVLGQGDNLCSDAQPISRDGTFAFDNTAACGCLLLLDRRLVHRDDIC